jgi:hypothetical protein
MCAIEEQIERAANLKLLGATGIEDKLQVWLRVDFCFVSADC